MEKVEIRLAKALEDLSRADIFWLLEETIIAYEEKRARTDMEVGEARRAAAETILEQVLRHVDLTNEGEADNE